MRNSAADLSYEEAPRDIVATVKDYPSGFVFGSHSHARGQFAFADSGVITVLTAQGNWVVPPRRAFWVPAGVPHEMRMKGPVRMLNAFVRSGAKQGIPLRSHCCVLNTSPLLRQLLLEGVNVPANYDLDGRPGRLMALLLDEIAEMKPLTLNAPIPTDLGLATLCYWFIEHPSLSIGIDCMAHRCGMSRRTFTRHFREQVGVSFSSWRQQVCLMSAITRLGEGHAVTQIAMDLGYSSHSAFTALFTRILGESPTSYIRGS